MSSRVEHVPKHVLHHALRGHARRGPDAEPVVDVVPRRDLVPILRRRQSRHRVRAGRRAHAAGAGEEPQHLGHADAARAVVSAVDVALIIVKGVGRSRRFGKDTRAEIEPLRRRAQLPGHAVAAVFPERAGRDRPERPERRLLGLEQVLPVPSLAAAFFVGIFVFRAGAAEVDVIAVDERVQRGVHPARVQLDALPRIIQRGPRRPGRLVVPLVQRDTEIGTVRLGSALFVRRRRPLLAKTPHSLPARERHERRPGPRLVGVGVGAVARETPAVAVAPTGPVASPVGPRSGFRILLLLLSFFQLGALRGPAPVRRERQPRRRPRLLHALPRRPVPVHVLERLLERLREPRERSPPSFLRDDAGERIRLNLHPPTPRVFGDTPGPPQKRAARGSAGGRDDGPARGRGGVHQRDVHRADHGGCLVAAGEASRVRRGRLHDDERASHAQPPLNAGRAPGVILRRVAVEPVRQQGPGRGGGFAGRDGVGSVPETEEDVWGTVLGVVEDDGVRVGSKVVHLVVDQRAEASEIPAAVLRPGASRRLRREILVGEAEPSADDGLDVVDGALPRGLDAEVVPPAVILLLLVVVVVVVLVVVRVVVGPRITEGVEALTGDPRVRPIASLLRG